MRELIPVPEDRHPLGRHRRRASDLLCLWGMLLPSRDGLLVGGRCGRVGVAGVGHDDASATKRVAQRRCVRPGSDRAPRCVDQLLGGGGEQVDGLVHHRVDGAAGATVGLHSCIQSRGDPVDREAVRHTLRRAQDTFQGRSGSTGCATPSPSCSKAESSPTTNDRPRPRLHQNSDSPDAERIAWLDEQWLLADQSVTSELMAVELDGQIS